MLVTLSHGFITMTLVSFFPLRADRLFGLRHSDQLKQYQKNFNPSILFVTIVVLEPVFGALYPNLNIIEPSYFILKAHENAW